MPIASINPATGQTIKTFDPLSEQEIDQRLARAASAFASYRLTGVAQRAAWVNGGADILDRERDDVARVMPTEMGKTIGAACAEVTKCASACRYYADHAEGFLADEPADAAAGGASRALPR